MGAIAERTRSKFGRFRPYIVFGSPILAFFTALCFTNPFLGTSTAGIIWAAFTYIVTGMLYTLVNIPYGALGAVMTEDAEQRNRINASRNIGMNLGILIVNGLSSFVMLFFSKKGATVPDSNGYLYTSILYALISVPCFLGVFLTSKENIIPKGKPEKFSFHEVIKNLLSNKYLMVMLGIMVFGMCAQMGRISVVIFYIIYNLGSFQLIPVIMLTPSILGIVSSLLVPKAIQKFGKRNVLILGYLGQAASLLVLYFIPYSDIIGIIIANGLFGFFNVAFPCSLGMISDAIEYYELQTGIRSDGVAYATYGLSQKLGTAIGSSFGIVIMSAFGYVPNAQQSLNALMGINFTVNLLPALLFIIAAIIAWRFWRITDEVSDEVRLRLFNK